MVSINDLLRSGKVQLNDRRKLPRFRFRGPVQIIAVDVVGAIVPTDIAGWTTDVSTEGAVLTVEKKLTTKGIFVRFADSDDLVMPATVTRKVCESGGHFTYAVAFTSFFEDRQLLQILNHQPESGAEQSAPIPALPIPARSASE